MQKRAQRPDWGLQKRSNIGGYYYETGKRGDFRAIAKILVPKQISKEERELYEKLQKITKFKPRKN